MSLPDGFLPIHQIHPRGFGYVKRNQIEKTILANCPDALIGHNEIDHTIIVYNGPDSSLVLSTLIQSIVDLSNDRLLRVEQTSQDQKIFTISLIPEDFSEPTIPLFQGSGQTAFLT